MGRLLKYLRGLPAWERVLIYLLSYCAFALYVYWKLHV